MAILYTLKDLLHHPLLLYQYTETRASYSI